MAEIKNILNSQARSNLNLKVEITVPGDKSISHRSMILGGIAEGITLVSGFLESADCLATMHAMQSMGVQIEKQSGKGNYLVYGLGKRGLKQPLSGDIDCGNSGTGMRLLSGILAAQRFDSTLTGDESLNTRPMMRIIKPLEMMGANVKASKNGTAPLRFTAVKELHGIHYDSPVASAQVKSCILLAGLYCDGNLLLSEPKLSRDHTENMLRGFGCKLKSENLTINMQGGQTLSATDVVVPADISSAAFFMVLATLLLDSEIVFKNLCINPSRTGVIDILKLMGADISFINHRTNAGEKIADVVVKSSSLQGIEIPHEYIASAIDEFPVLFVAAALAQGQTKLTNALELRKKESDRITVMANGLKKLGIECQELADGLIINGGQLSGGHVDAEDDHRCAMSFLIAGQFSRAKIKVENCENIMTSFPNFLDICSDLGLQIS